MNLAERLQSSKGAVDGDDDAAPSACQVQIEKHLHGIIEWLSDTHVIAALIDKHMVRLLDRLVYNILHALTKSSCGDGPDPSPAKREVVRTGALTDDASVSRFMLCDEVTLPL
jgi:hypothetical protein